MSDETFEKLEVWQRAHETAVRLHELLRECRDFGFRQQITDSADSKSGSFSATPRVPPGKPVLDCISRNALATFPLPNQSNFLMNYVESPA